MSNLGITNSETIVERRTKLLELEGNGFNQSEIVKELSKKFQCCERTVYRDFQTRKEWQPCLTSHSERQQAYYNVLNRYEQIYRKASFIYLHGDNDNSKIGALRVMLDSLSKLTDLANITNEDQQKEISYTLKWCRPATTKEKLESRSFNDWVKENHKDKVELLTQLARLYILYNQNSKEDESIH